jgi:hypothetical protein
MQERSLQETRRHQRVDFDRRAWCEHHSLTLYLPVSNVSLGGMFLQTTTPFETGDRLRISFEEPTGERIVAQVEIVWAGKSGRSSGVGCRLLGFLEGSEAFGRMVRGLARD